MALPLSSGTASVTDCDVSKIDEGMALMLEEQFNHELGARIRTAREAANLTQEALASAVGLTRGSIANIERGYQASPIYRLALIAKALKVDLPALVPGVDGYRSQVDRLHNQLPAPYAQAVSAVRTTARSKRRRSARG
jgi:transcriptional regulator with XRE-family HTH domain